MHSKSNELFMKSTTKYALAEKEKGHFLIKHPAYMGVKMSNQHLSKR